MQIYSAILTSDESKFKKFENIKKKIIYLKKRIHLIKEKLEDSKVEDIFNRRKGSESFIKNLSKMDFFNLPTSISISSNEKSEVRKFQSSSKLHDSNSKIDGNNFA